MLTNQAKKVLIIEDSPTQAAVIASLVEQVGYYPIVYNVLSTGISQILALENPDLVLLDLRLLDKDGNVFADGFQLCREIKRAPDAPPVAVITSEEDDEACEWAMMQGADGFLQKPFVAGDLFELMSQIFS